MLKYQWICLVFWVHPRLVYLCVRATLHLWTEGFVYVNVRKPLSSNGYHGSLKSASSSVCCSELVRLGILSLLNFLISLCGLISLTLSCNHLRRFGLQAGFSDVVSLIVLAIDLQLSLLSFPRFTCNGAQSRLLHGLHSSRPCMNF